VEKNSFLLGWSIIYLFCKREKKGGFAMDSNRPLLDFYGFGENKELVLKTTALLKKYYSRYARKNRGYLSNQGLEAEVFQKIYASMDRDSLSMEQRMVLEAIFDQFMGSVAMYGDGLAAIKQIEALAAGDIQKVKRGFGF
jgi:hypothetical protein